MLSYGLVPSGQEVELPVAIETTPVHFGQDGADVVGGVIQRHGGEIRAESEPGQGATFWFTLGA